MDSSVSVGKSAQFCLVLVCLVLALIACAARGALAMGALAVDPAGGFGFSYESNTAEKARAAALSKCPNCKVVALFQHTCAAYAADRPHGSGAYGLASAPDKDQAQSTALATCQGNGGAACTVRVWACEKTKRRDNSAWLIDYAAPARPDDLVEEKTYLRTKMGGQTVRLEAEFVKSAGAQGRLPVAFVNAGRPASAEEAIDQSVDIMRPVARDLARRGWLAVMVGRRGYGQSDGAIQTDDPKCQKDTLISWMYSDADEILAALDVVAKRPDADASRVLTIGHSAGGGESVAFGARNPPGLVAVVNLSGGEHWPGCPVNDFIPVDFKDLGSHSHVPNLWVFAKNDPNHPPDQVELMRAAFAGAGGDVRVVELEPLGENGHTEMLGAPGRTQWLVELDAFLRAHNLPTWPLENVDLTRQRLGWPESLRGFVQVYLGAPGEKALARTPNSTNASYHVSAKMDAARSAALQSCEAKGLPCEIVMENNVWVGPR
ncbi:MAG: DUF4189 domain-containing protein [Beijerinckiaceae bacterium]|jgi:dienelactone hydrolase